jgi:hypothetical protein
MVLLPPDLSQLGDELTAAAARAVAERRRRRRRVARALTSGAAGLLTVLALAPATLSPDGRTASLLARGTQDTLVLRLPEHPPVTLARYAPDRDAIGARRPAPPPFPSLTVRRNA